MFPAPLLALALAATPLSCSGGEPVTASAPWPAAADSLVALYEKGMEWRAFLQGVRARRQAWYDNYTTATVDATTVERLARVPGRWRFLVVAVDACGDSANTIPYLARLVEASERLDLRVVNPTEGAWVMAARRSEDGRAATPTVVLLDEDGRERGCWVERPYALRQVLDEHRAGRIGGSFVEVITAWREQDRGRSTVEDMVALLEGAVTGTARCP